MHRVYVNNNLRRHVEGDLFSQVKATTASQSVAVMPTRIMEELLSQELSNTRGEVSKAVTDLFIDVIGLRVGTKL